MGDRVRREWLLLTACLSVLALLVVLDAGYGADLTLSGAYGLALVLASTVSLPDTVPARCRCRTP